MRCRHGNDSVDCPMLIVIHGKHGTSHDTTHRMTEDDNRGRIR